ncbi:hypothetical protein ACVWW1_008898 [Bradyrhizobium sp. JR3.5]
MPSATPAAWRTRWRARGFSASIVLDPNLTAIDAALKAFRPAAQSAELALIYLAGHAVERHGSGYFLAVDFSFPSTAAGLRYTAAVGLNAFVEAASGAASRIAVLDACRNWPHDPDEARCTSNDLEEFVAKKGKAHRPYEFGVKVCVATTLSHAKGGQFVAHVKVLPGNDMMATRWPPSSPRWRR